MKASKTAFFCRCGLVLVVGVAVMASTVSAGHGSKDMPVWAPTAGIGFAENVEEVEIGVVTTAQVIDAAKLARFIDNPDFACARGDIVKVKMVSQTKFELIFPKQETKAKAHFKTDQGRLKAILDWLGTL